MKHLAISAAVAVVTSLAGHSLLWTLFGVAVVAVYLCAREAA